MTKGTVETKIGNSVGLVQPPLIKSNIEFSLYELIQRTKDRCYQC